MTFLELVNDVLQEMREDTVATWDENDYSALIGKFVNDAKRKVEDAWNWSALRTTIQINTTAAEEQYILSGAGKRFRILRKKDGSPDIYNQSGQYFMKIPPQGKLTEWLLADQETGNPEFLGFNDFDATGDPQLDVYPIPDAAYVINFNVVVPQDDLAADATELEVPSGPVLREAIYRAIRERGEDGGYGVRDASEDARIALADALTWDRILYMDELYWESV